MLNGSKKVIFFALLIICPATSYAWHDYSNYGEWDYYGSGRDHAYSAYIDRHYYVGPADYVTIQPDYIEGPLVISNAPGPVITPVPAPVITQVPAPLPSAQGDQFTINIPNARGGFNAVVIKKSGDGFVGPQGEYYPEFPKIFQLQTKYGN